MYNVYVGIDLDRHEVMYCTYMRHELLDYPVPFARHRILHSIGSIRINIDDVAERGDASNFLEQIHRKAVEAVVACIVLTVTQHDVRPFLS